MMSGSLLTNHSWRWTFWTIVVLVSIETVSAFLIPETYYLQIIHLRDERQTARKLRQNRRRWVSLLVSIGRPLHMMLVEPIIFPSSFVLAITQAVLLAYYAAYVALFEQEYGFSQYQVGMAFGPLLVGSVLAVPIVAVFDKKMCQPVRTEAIASESEISSEKRLFPAMLGSITLPISIFWYAIASPQ